MSDIITENFILLDDPLPKSVWLTDLTKWSDEELQYEICLRNMDGYYGKIFTHNKKPGLLKLIREFIRREDIKNEQLGLNGN